jgi:hypothetical protein
MSSFSMPNLGAFQYQEGSSGSYWWLGMNDFTVIVEVGMSLAGKVWI